jgi:predicted nucleic acid-binding Zn ribbon protein
MNCPKCGLPIPDGVAYCSNPACGAVTGAPAPRAERHIKIEKTVKLNFKLDFVKLARLAAAIIALLAGAYLYFFARH